MKTRLWQISAVTILVLTISASGQEVFERESGLFATAPIRAAAAVTPQARVQIASAMHLSGSLTFTSSDDDSLRIVYQKVAKTPRKSEAFDYIDLISVVLTGRPDDIKVKLRSPNPAPWAGTNNSGRVEAEIFVPPGATIEILARTFDVTVNGPVRGVDIPESLGRIDINDVTEHVSVVTANRRVSLKNITGEVAATTSNSSLIAETITTPGTQARLRNDGGDILVDGLTGSINARNSFGRITLRDFSPSGEISYIRGASGPVAIEISSIGEGQLVVTNRQEDIDLSVPDSVSAFFTLSVDEGSVIEVSNLPFTPDLVQSSRVSLQSGDGLAEIRGSVKSSGNIYVRGRSGD